MLKALRRAKAFYKINPTLGSCPSCKSAGTLKRSHSRNMYEKILHKITIYKMYRCKCCGWRGYLKTIAITSTSFLILLLYLTLISGAALITYQILKRLL